MAGVKLDVNSDSTRARQDLSKLNQKLAEVFRSANKSGTAIDSISAKRFKDLNKPIKDSTKNIKDFGKQSTESMKNASNSANGLGAALKGTIASVVALGSAFLAIKGANALNKTSDDLTKIENKLKLVTNGTEDLISTFERLNKQSRENRVDLASTTQLYVTLRKSLSSSLTSVGDIERVMSIIQKSVALSGASAESAKSAIVQLGQGLSAGALRGQEYLSVMEQLPYTADLLARSFGKTRGELKKLADTGQITTEAILSNFLKMEASVGADFQKTVLTAEQAIEQMNSRISQFFGNLNRISGFSEGFSKRIVAITDAFERATLSLIAFSGSSKTAADTFKRNFLSLTNAKIALDAVMASPIDPFYAYRKYTETKELRDNLVGTNALIKEQISERKKLRDFGVTNESIDSTGSIDAEIPKIVTFRSVAIQTAEAVKELFRFFKITAVNISQYFGSILTPVYRLIHQAGIAIVDFQKQMDIAVNRSVVPFLRAIQNINEYLVFWERDTNIERAWSRLFRSDSISDFVTNLKLLNNEREKGARQNWDIWIEDANVEYLKLKKSVEGVLISLNLMDQRFFSVRFFRVDKILQDLQTIGGAISTVYRDVFKTYVDRYTTLALNTIKLNLSVIVEYFTDRFGDNVAKGIGGILGSFIVTVLQGIRAAVIQGTSLLKDIFTLEGSLEIDYRDFFKVFEFIKSLFTSFASTIYKGLDLGSLVEDLILKPLASAKVAVHGFMQRMAKTIGDLSFNKALEAVKSFTQKVKDYFFDVYDAVVGNSYWPDLVDGVNNKANELISGESRVARFAATIKNTFRSLDQTVGNLFTNLIARVSSVVSTISTANWTGIAKELSSNLSAAFISAFLITRQSVIAKLGGTLFFSGLFDISANNEKNPFLNQTLAISDSVIQSFTENLLKGLSNAFTTIVTALPTLFSSIFSSFGLFGNILDGIIRTLTLNYNVIITGAIGALITYILFAEKKLKALQVVAYNAIDAWRGVLPRIATIGGVNFNALGIASIAAFASGLLDGISASQAIIGGIGLALASALGGKGFARLVFTAGGEIGTAIAKSITRMLLGQGAIDSIAKAWESLLSRGAAKADPLKKFSSFKRDSFKKSLDRYIRRFKQDTAKYADGAISLTDLLLGDPKKFGSFAGLSSQFKRAFNIKPVGLDNLRKSLDKLKVTSKAVLVDGLISSVSDFGAVLRRVSGTALANFVTSLNGMFGLIRGNLSLILITGGLFSTFAFASDGASTAIADLVSEAGKLVVLTTVLGAAVASVKVLGSSFAAFGSAYKAFAQQNFAELWEQAAPQREVKLNTLRAVFGDNPEIISSEYEAYLQAQKAAIQREAKSGAFVVGAKAAVEEFRTGMAKAFGPFQTVVRNISNGMFALIGGIGAFYEKLAAAIVVSARAVKAGFGGLSGVLTDLKTLFEGVRTLSLGAAISDIRGRRAERASVATAAAAGAGLGEVISDAFSLKRLKDFGNALKSTVGAIVSTLGAIGSNIKGLFLGILSVIGSLGKALLGLVSPFILKIAAVAGGAGLLAVAFFGTGETFFEKLQNAYDGARALIGLAPTGRVAREKEILGGFDSRQIGDYFLNFGGLQDTIDFEELTVKQYELLKEYGNTVAEAVNSAEREAFRNNEKLSQETKKSLDRTVKDYIRFLSKLPVREGLERTSFFSAANITGQEEQNSFIQRLLRLSGSNRGRAIGAIPEDTVFDGISRQIDAIFNSSYISNVGKTLDNAILDPLRGLGGVLDGLIEGIANIGVAPIDVALIRLQKDLKGYSESLTKNQAFISQEESAKLKEANDALVKVLKERDRFKTLVRPDSDDFAAAQAYDDQLKLLDTRVQLAIDALGKSASEITAIAENRSIIEPLQTLYKTFIDDIGKGLSLDFGDVGQNFFGGALGKEILTGLKKTRDAIDTRVKDNALQFVAESGEVDFDAYLDAVTKANIDAARINRLAAAESGRQTAEAFADSYLSAIQKRTSELGFSDTTLKRLLSREGPREEISGIVNAIDILEARMANVDLGSREWGVLNDAILNLRGELVKQLPSYGLVQDIETLTSKLGIGNISNDVIANLETNDLKQFNDQLAVTLQAREKLRNVQNRIQGGDVIPEEELAALKEYNNSLRESNNALLQLNITSAQGAIQKLPFGEGAVEVSRIFNTEIPNAVAQSESKLNEWAALFVSKQEYILAMSEAKSAEAVRNLALALDYVNNRLDKLAEKITSSRYLSFDMQLGFDLNEAQLASKISSAKPLIDSVIEEQELRQNKLLSSVGLQESLRREQEALDGLFNLYKSELGKSGQGVVSVLNDIGVTSARAIAQASPKIIDQIVQNKAEILALTRTLQGELTNEELKANQDRISQLEKQNERYARTLNESYTTRVGRLSDLLSNITSEQVYARATAGFRRIFDTAGLYLEDLRKDLEYGLISENTFQGVVDSVTPLLSVLNKVQTALTAVADASKQGFKSAFDSIQSSLNLVSEELLAFTRIGANTREEMTRQATALNEIFEISQMQDLPRAVSDAISKGNFDNAPELLASIQAAMEGIFGENVFASPLDNNTKAIKDLTAAILGKPIVSATAKTGNLQTSPEGTNVKSTANISAKDIEIAPVDAAAVARKVAVAGINSSYKLLQETADKSGSLFSQVRTYLDFLNIDSSKLDLADAGRLRDISSAVGDAISINKELGLAIANNSPDVQRLTRDAREASNRLSELSSSIRDLGADTVAAGKDFSEDMKDSIKGGLSDAIKGKTSFAEFGEILLDKFTSNVIDTFVSGLVDNVFDNFLEDFFSGIGSGQYGLGDSVGKSVSDSFIGTFFEDVTNQMKVGFSDTANEITGISFFDTLLGFLNTGFSGLVNGVSKLFGGSGGFDLLGSIGGFFGFGGGGGGAMTGGAALDTAFGISGLATGGYVRGPGSATSDSIMAMLSNGEFVINSKATKAWLPLLEQINRGALPKFAEGGMVGYSSSLANIAPEKSESSSENVVVNINITGDISKQTRREVLGMSNEIANMVHGSFREKRIL